MLDLYSAKFHRLCILEGDLGERADKSAMAAINRALRFTRKDGDPFHWILPL